jgi:hypothetical protein
MFYNRRRPHSNIGYRTPARAWADAHQTAAQELPGQPDTSEITEDLSTILDTAQSWSCR